MENFNFNQGNLKNSEKSRGILEFSKTVHCLQASKRYNSYKLQAVYGQKHYFHNSHGLRHSFIN